MVFTSRSPSLFSRTVHKARPRGESNPHLRFCKPLQYHYATRPGFLTATGLEPVSFRATTGHFIQLNYAAKTLPEVGLEPTTKGYEPREPPDYSGRPKGGTRTHIEWHQKPPPCPSATFGSSNPSLGESNPHQRLRRPLLYQLS